MQVFSFVTNARLEAATNRSSNTLEAQAVFFVHSCIDHILGVGRCTDITGSIVHRVKVAMIDFIRHAPWM